MHDLDLYAMLRWANAALAAAALVRMLVRARTWMGLPPPLPMHWLGLVGLTVVVGWAAITGLITGRPGGVYVAACTVVLIWLNVAAWWPLRGVRLRHARDTHHRWRRPPAGT